MKKKCWVLYVGASDQGKDDSKYMSIASFKVESCQISDLAPPCKKSASKMMLDAAAVWARGWGTSKCLKSSWGTTGLAASRGEGSKAGRNEWQSGSDETGLLLSDPADMYWQTVPHLLSLCLFSSTTITGPGITTSPSRLREMLAVWLERDRAGQRRDKIGLALFQNSVSPGWHRLVVLSPEEQNCLINH